MKKKKIKKLLKEFEAVNETAQDILCKILPNNHRGNLIQHASQVSQKLQKTQELLTAANNVIILLSESHGNHTNCSICILVDSYNRSKTCVGG